MRAQRFFMWPLGLIAAACSTGNDVTDRRGAGGSEEPAESSGGTPGDSVGVGGDAGEGESPSAGGASVTPESGGSPATGGGGGQLVGGVGGGGGARSGGAGGQSVVVGGGTAPDCGKHPLCDSFETYAVGTSPQSSAADANWRIASGAENLKVDDRRAFSGKHSLKIQIPAGDTAVNAMLTTLRKDLVPATKLFARMMYFLDGTPVGPSPFHWVFMQADGVFPSGSNLGRSSASLGLGGWSSSPKSGWQEVMNTGALDCWNHTNSPIPTGRWVCVEWALDSTTHTQKLTVDKVSVSQATFTLNLTNFNSGCIGAQNETQWYIPPIARFSVGYSHFHTSLMPRTLWMDDVVVSKEPIGCPAPPP